MFLLIIAFIAGIITGAFMVFNTGNLILLPLVPLAAAALFLMIRGTIKYNLRFFIISLLIFILSFYIPAALFISRNRCSYSIHPIQKPDKSKTAVVFLYEGGPSLSNISSLVSGSGNIILTPFKIYNLKRNLSNYNADQYTENLETAYEGIKNILLNYRPCYAYIADISDRKDLYDCINNSLGDGCSRIIFVSYTSSDIKLSSLLCSDDEALLKESGILAVCTPSPLSQTLFMKYYCAKCLSFTSGSEYTLLVGNNSYTSEIARKISLETSKPVRVSSVNNIDKTIVSIRSEGIKNISVIYADSPGECLTSFIIRSKLQSFEKEGIKTNYMNGWGNDKHYYYSVAAEAAKELKHLLLP